MKKLIAVVLVLVALASLAGCGTVNKSEVSILWKEETVMVPNSLINAFERAMYIENISYKHYFSGNDAAKQLEQATQVVNAGCSALMVELVDSAGAQAYVDLAKGKNIPVVFFGCEVDEAVVSSYDKCVHVSTKAESVAESLSEKIIEGIVDEKEGLPALIAKLFKSELCAINKSVDRNEDGKISCLIVGDGAAIAEAVDAKLTEKGLNKLEMVGTLVDGESAKATLQSAVDGTYGEFGLLTVEGKPVELIITTDDVLGMTVLTELQAKGYNKDRLKTHFVSLYTVGSHADAKSLLNKDDYKEEEWEALIYTTLEVIEAGQISGAAMEDYDTIATSAAKCLKNLLKGKAVTNGIEAELVVKTRIVDVPYSIS